MSRLDDGDAEVRRIAVMELPYSDEDDILPLLTKAACDTDALVRAEAARGLEGFEEPEAVQALLPLLRDQNEETRRAASDTLSELKDDANGTLLLEWVGDSDAFVQAAVFRALRALRVPGALAPALSALEHPQASVRREATGVLGYLRNPGSLGPLTRVAMNDPDPEVRRIAVGALGFATDVDVLPALTHALSDTSWQVREEAASTAGKLKLAGAVEQLIKTMGDTYWQVRVRAARSLGRLKDAAALPVLFTALKHEISNLRKEAAIALGEIGDPKAIPALEEALKDPDPDVRKLTQLALKQIGAAAARS